MPNSTSDMKAKLLRLIEQARPPNEEMDSSGARLGFEFMQLFRVLTIDQQRLIFWFAKTLKNSSKAEGSASDHILRKGGTDDEGKL